MDHAEGAAQLTIPSHEGMDRGTAVDPLKSVVRALDNVEEAAGRAAPGIVLRREDFAEFVYGETKGIPAPAGDAAHRLAVGGAAEDPALTATVHLRSITGRENPVLPEVFP